MDLPDFTDSCDRLSGLVNPDSLSQLSVNFCLDIGFSEDRYGKGINSLRELNYFIFYEVTRCVISPGISNAVSTCVFHDE